MLKLIIADDEPIYRKAIQTIIDWESLGIEVVAVCRNGLETYEAIIDENPDIVLTDIKMPYLSGVELIEKAHSLSLDIEFIILSGFSEFEYAQEAMKFGVKHYLLKPCNENQIVKSVKEVIEICYKKRAIADFEKDTLNLSKNLQTSIMQNILFSVFSSKNSIEDIISEYEHSIDFFKTKYVLYYFYYVNEQTIFDIINKVTLLLQNDESPITLYPIYVKNTLIIFFKKSQIDYAEFDLNLKKTNESTPIETEMQDYENLYKLLLSLVKKCTRFHTIHLIDKNIMLSCSNHYVILEKAKELAHKKYIDDLEDVNEEIEAIITNLDTIDFLKTFISIFLVSETYVNSESTINTDFLQSLNNNDNIEDVKSSFLQFLDSSKKNTHKGFIAEILKYVKENIGNPNLSLKYISENLLYMNVDYVSKQFVKKTGMKFTAYINNERIEKAKTLLLDDKNNNIYEVANLVGFGNNPQYFSHTFKKYTNLTPSEFVKTNKQSQTM